MGLFKPAWESNNPEKRLKAVEKVTDREQLKEILRTSEHDDTALAAFRKLTDYSEKRQLVKENGRIKRWQYAMVLDLIGQTDDEEELRQFLTEHCRNKEVCEAALAKISRPEILARIVCLPDSCFGMFSADPRYSAFDKLMEMQPLDGAVVDDLLEHAGMTFRRMLEEKGISGQSEESLRRTALDPRASDLTRYKAIEQISDQAFLTDLVFAQNNPASGNDGVAYVAAKRIASPERLAKIVLEYRGRNAHKLRELISGRLRDPAPLLGPVLSGNVDLWTAIYAAECLFGGNRLTEDQQAQVMQQLTGRILELQNPEEQKRAFSALTFQVLKLKHDEERFGLRYTVHESVDGEGVECYSRELFYQGKRVGWV